MQLKDYLEANNIGRMEFAAKIGMHYSTLCKYLQGQRTPTYWAAKLIHEMTDGQVSIAELRRMPRKIVPKPRKPRVVLCLPSKRLRKERLRKEKFELIDNL